MSNTIFKNAFDKVEPDIYMESRLLAVIKDKHKKHFPLKHVLSGVLVMTVALGCCGAVYYQEPYVDRPFSVMLVDASDDIPVTAELDDDTVTIPDMQIIYDKKDGTIETNYEFGFGVVSDDIDFVQYKSKNGSFIYEDWQKVLFDQQNRNYFTHVIPVADDEVQEISEYIDGQLFNPEEAGLRHYAETHDLSEYFGSEDLDFGNYWVYFNKCADVVGYENEPGYAFFIIDMEKGISYSYYTMLDDNDSATDLTVRNYELSESTQKHIDDELKYVHYSPDAAIDAIFDNPDINKSELPDDEITIIATFKDGKKAKKVISVFFNEEGFAQFSVK